MVTLESTLRGLREILNRVGKLPDKPNYILENEEGYLKYIKARVILNLELYEFVKRDYPAIDKFSLKGISLKGDNP